MRLASRVLILLVGRFQIVEFHTQIRTDGEAPEWTRTIIVTPSDEMSAIHAPTILSLDPILSPTVGPRNETTAECLIITGIHVSNTERLIVNGIFDTVVATPIEAYSKAQAPPEIYDSNPTIHQRLELLPGDDSERNYVHGDMEQAIANVP